MIINGDMRIFQRGTSFTSVATNTYTLDRWQYVKSGSMVHTVSQSSDAPTDTQSGYQFLNSLDATVTTAQASIGVNDENFIRQSIEGYNFSSFARQKPFTISFWVKATVTGTYCIALRNSGNDRSYIAEYSVSSSNTWEYKTVTIATPTPSGGTWDYGSGIGLQVLFVMAAGTNRQTTANSWQTGNFIATSNQVNAVGTNGNVFRITGVSLNEGSSAQLFRLFANSADGEVAACQRYYEKSYNLDVTPGIASFNGQELFRAHTVNHYHPISFRVTKRASPSSIVFYNSASGNAGTWRDSSAIADRSVGSADAGQKGFGGLVTSSVDGNVMNGQWTADAEL